MKAIGALTSSLRTSIPHWLTPFDLVSRRTCQLALMGPVRFVPEA